MFSLVLAVFVFFASKGILKVASLVVVGLATVVLVFVAMLRDDRLSEGGDAGWKLVMIPLIAG